MHIQRKPYIGNQYEESEEQTDLLFKFHSANIGYNRMRIVKEMLFFSLELLVIECRNEKQQEQRLD